MDFLIAACISAKIVECIISLGPHLKKCKKRQSVIYMLF